MNKNIYAIFILQLILSQVSSRRLYRKVDCNNNVQLTDAQNRYLEEIQVLARKGGMEEEEWQGITEYDEEVCYEIDCLESAIEVMQSTNFSVDPCQSRKWLEFACSRRVNGPDNINQLERLIKFVEKQTLALLEDDSGTHDKDFLFKEAQTYFHQCNHKERADDSDVTDILKYMEKYGNWPILTNKDPGERFNWLHMLADLNKIERSGYIPYFLQVHVPEFFTKLGPIELNAGRTIFHVTNKDLINMLTLVQKKSGSKKPVRIDQIVPMLTLLANISSVTVFQEEGQNVTIDEFQKLTDMYLAERKMEFPVDWLSFFKRVFEGAETINVTPDLEVKVCFRKTMSILSAIYTAMTSKQKIERWALANLFHFQFVSTLLQEATTLLDDKNSFRCVELTGDRKEFCLAAVEEAFGYALGATYIKTYYDDRLTPVIEKLVDVVKKAYVDVIGKTSWMEKSTKEFLQDKVKSIKTFISYPKWILEDNDKMLKFFDGLDVSTNRSSSYPMNYLNLTIWRLNKKRSWSYKYHNLTTWKGFPLYDVEWNHYPATVQAQYHKAINEARIEAGVIQKPIFGINRPGFMNFGGLGMIIGHEFGHMYDPIGRLFNKDGENEKEYWDEKSLDKYYDWVQQIAYQYGTEQYPLSETSAETIDPLKTINEDIADILAVYISNHAYQIYLRELESKGEKEKVLPGLKKFSPLQLFYMKYANMWCDNKNIQDRYNDMLGDHSTGNTRATLPLKYSRQFAKAFGCKLSKGSDNM